MKKVFATLFFCVGFYLSAQNSYEAFNYGLKESQGSARMISMGGAFTALGGDLASVMINPAGLGIKRLDEFSLSMGYEARNRNSTFTKTGAQNSDVVGNVNIPNINYVITSNYGKKNNIRRLNFGLGYNRTHNLNFSTISSGKGNFASYISSLSNEMNVNKFGPNFLNEKSIPFVAYYTYMVDYDTLGGQYIPSSRIPGQRTEISETVTGSMSEFYFNLSISIKDRLYLGANLSFPTINSTRQLNVFEGEYVQADSFEFNGVRTQYQELILEDFLDVQGNAVKGSFGLLYRPTKYLRLGLAYHTPHSYTMTESQIVSGKSTFTTGLEIQRDYGISWEPYGMTLPSEVNAGFAIVFGKKGLWSMDVHYTDLSKINYFLPNVQGDAFSYLNTRIQNTFKEVFTFKTGFELNVKKYTRLRAGFEYKTSGLQHDNLPQSIMPSLGYGYAKEGFYFDLAYSLQITGVRRNLYNNFNTNDTPIDSEVNSQNHRLVATVGWKLY